MLRLVSYNIKSGLHHPEGLDAIAATVRALDPDVVALQEVDRGTERSGDSDQAARLADACGLKHHAFGVATPWFGGGEYGIALLSRFPLGDVQTAPLWVPTDPAAAQGLREPRALLSASLDADGTPVRAFVAHLGLDEEQRRIQAHEIAAALQKSFAHASPVLMGDLNDVPGSPPVAALTATLQDAHAHLAAAERGTFPAGARAPERVAIDYVMVPERWSVGRAWVYHDEPAPTASDHYAVAAEVEPA